MMVWCILLSLDISTHAQEGQIKNALIAAVSDYPQEADWPLIPFAAQSAKTFQEKGSQYFRMRQSRLLLNGHATATKIRQALNEMAENTNEGERLILYLSGMASVDDSGFLSFEGFQTKIVKGGRARIRMSQLMPDMPEGSELLLIADLTLAKGNPGTIPPKAKVSISPNPKKWDPENAITPLRVVLEKNTPYTIKVTRSGYEPVSRTITFDRGGQFELELRLRRMPIMARLKTLIRPARGSSDSYGNPVVKGTDLKTGLYLEGVERKTGMHLVLNPSMAVMEEGESLPGAAYVGKYEVTNPEYEYFSGRHSINRGKKYLGKVISPSDDSPVIMVSWHDVWKFCLWMSNNDSDLFRLPFANEWSQVYRRGWLGNRRRSKKIAVDFGKYANFPDLTAQLRFNWDWEPATTDPFATTAPVGRLRPNASSIYHMDGNVWDSQNTKSDRQQSRLCVGGSWLDRPAGLGPANRTLLEADDKKITVGFRVFLPIILD